MLTVSSNHFINSFLLYNINGIENSKKFKDFLNNSIILNRIRFGVAVN